MKTQKAATKKVRILQAAAKVLAEKGYSVTTLADIASEAGTFAGSLYYYFSSKDSIVEEVLNIGTTSVSTLVAEKMKSLPPNLPIHDKIRIALETHLQQMLAKDDFVVAYWKVIDQVPDDVRQKHLALPREYGQFWQQMLVEAQHCGEIRTDVDARLMRLLLIGSTIYALQWFRPGGGNTPSEIADALAEMFLLGVVPRGACPDGATANSTPRPLNARLGSDSESGEASRHRPGDTALLKAKPRPPKPTRGKKLEPRLV